MTLHTSASGDAGSREVLFPGEVTVVVNATDFTTIGTVGKVMVPAPGVGFYTFPIWASYDFVPDSTGVLFTGQFDATLVYSSGVAGPPDVTTLMTASDNVPILMDSATVPQLGFTVLSLSAANAEDRAFYENRPLYLMNEVGNIFPVGASSVPTAVGLNSSGSGYFVGQALVDSGGDLTIVVNAVDLTPGVDGAIVAFTVTSFGTVAYAINDTIPLASVDTLSITGVNTGTSIFTVAGDQTAKFVVGGLFSVSGSTGNDGAYTPVSITLNAGNTDIEVSSISDATVDGSISPGGSGALIVTGITVTSDATLTVIIRYEVIPLRAA